MIDILFIIFIVSMLFIFWDGLQEGRITIQETWDGEANFLIVILLVIAIIFFFTSTFSYKKK